MIEYLKRILHIYCITQTLQKQSQQISELELCRQADAIKIKHLQAAVLRLERTTGVRGDDGRYHKARP